MLYEENGPDCVEDFNGDFAFAIWDSRKNRLVLARDRMGVRPLFYTTRDGVLYFASEVKALLQAPGIAAELDPDRARPDLHLLVPARAAHAVQGHLRAAAGPSADRRGRQGHGAPVLAADLSGRRGRARRGTTAAKAPIAEELRALLLDATRIRLRSDVPVGAYLSGGLDSSIVTAAVKRIRPDRLRTFSVTFEIRRVRRERLPAGHGARARHRARVGRLHAPPTSAARFPNVIRHTERPILRTAPAPLLRAVRASCTRSGFKVVLTGEGADEVFAGYDIFKEAKIRRFCARAAATRAWRPLLLKRLYPYLPQLQGQSQSYLEAFFGARRRRDRRPAVLAPAALPHHRRRQAVLLRRAARGAARATTRSRSCASSLPADFARWHPLSQAQYLETALPAARLHPVVAGRPRGDGACGRGPLPVPRSSRGRVRLAHSAEAEDPGPAREAHPARGDEGPAAAAHRQPHQAALSRARQPVLRRRARAGLCRRSARPPADIAAAGSSTPRAVEQARRQVPQPDSSSASATTWRSSACCRRSSGIANSSQGATVASEHPFRRCVKPKDRSP